MNHDGDKKTGMIRALIAIILLVSIASGVWTFCNGKFTRTGESVYVFDGWIYGREDQKKASAALSAAGLSDYSWHNGKLSAPSDKKGEYQSVLASAGAYPKAPSELRADAVREMSVFESDSKTRLRELNACVMQLERTIEQMRGVEYATVGVRSRREQVGLVTKNIITASVGVAYLDGFELDSDALAAITLSAKHQLGVDDVSNISIIDLREGKSYLGVENSVVGGSDLVVASEKERIEKYWRDKYLETFSNIDNIRVSVVADVIASSNALSPETTDPEPAAADSNISSASYVAVAPNVADVKPDALQRFAASPTQGRFETLDNLSECADGIGEVSSDASGKASSEKNASLNATEDSRKACGFAQLGNPRKAQKRSSNKKREPVVAQVEPLSESVANSFRTAAKFQWTDSVASSKGRIPELELTACEKHSDEVSCCASFFESCLMNGVVGSEFYSKDLSSAREAPAHKNVFKPLASIRQTNSVLPASNAGSEPAASRSDTTLRSIAVRISVPRSYLRRVVVRDAENSSPETFAEDPAEKTLAEIKRVAVDLFRPTSERLGWSEEDLDRWFVVASFLDLGEGGNDSTNVAEANDVQKDGFEHSSGYVFEGNDWNPVFPANVQQDSLSSEALSQGNRVVVTEPGGKIAEISQTVASDVEKRDADENQKTVELKNSVVAFLTRCKSQISQRLDSDVLNIALIVLLALAVVFCLFVVTRRAAKKRAAKKHDETNREKQKASVRESVSKSAVSNVREISREDYLDDLDEFDDELEGSLQEIAAVHGASLSRQASGRGTESAKPSASLNSPSDEYWNKRQEALELIARYPERAAASLQKWAKNA